MRTLLALSLALLAACSRTFTGPPAQDAGDGAPTLSAAQPAQAFAGQVVLLRGQNLGARPADATVRFGTTLAGVGRADPDAGLLEVTVPDLGRVPLAGVEVAVSVGGHAATLEGGFAYRGPGHPAGFSVQALSDLSPRPAALAVRGELRAYWLGRLGQLEVETVAHYHPVVAAPDFVPVRADVAGSGETATGWFFQPRADGSTRVVEVAVADGNAALTERTVPPGSALRGTLAGALALGPAAGDVPRCLAAPTAEPVLGTALMALPEGDLVAAVLDADGGPRVWRVQVALDGGLADAGLEPAPELAGRSLRGVALSPDGSALALLASDGALHEKLFHHAFGQPPPDAAVRLARTSDLLAASASGALVAYDDPPKLEAYDWSGAKTGGDFLGSPLSDLTLDLADPRRAAALVLSPPAIDLYEADTASYVSRRLEGDGLAEVLYSPGEQRLLASTNFPVGVAALDAQTALAPGAGAFQAGRPPGAPGDTPITLIAWAGDRLACAELSTGLFCAPPEELLGPNACPLLASEFDLHSSSVLKTDPQGRLLVVGGARAWICQPPEQGCALDCAPAPFDGQVPASDPWLSVTDDLATAVSGGAGADGRLRALVLQGGAAPRAVPLPGQALQNLQVEPATGSLAVAAASPGLVAAVDLATGQQLAQLDVAGVVQSIHFSPDGKRVYLSTLSQFLLEFDLADLTGGGLVEPRRVVSTPAVIDSIRPSPSGGRLLLFSNHNPVGDLLWSVE